MAEIKELVDKVGKISEDFKLVREKIDKDIKSHGEMLAETKEQFEKSFNDLAEAAKKANEKAAELEKRLDEYETQKNSPFAPKDEALAQEAKGLFWRWARSGRFDQADKKKYIEYALKDVPLDERKALSTLDDTASGYLVAPPEYVNEIIKGEVEFSPIRSIARIRPTSRQSIKWPVRTGTFSAQWVGEKQTKSETTGLTYGQEEIHNYEMYALVDISNQDLEDSAFDLEAELRAEFAEQFGVCEGAAFVSGNKVGKPEGFLSNSSISYTASGVADELTADGIIGITFDLKAAYARNAYFVLNRSTLKTVATLKDGAGQYLWKPLLETGAPMRIYGYPYIEATDMPDIAAGTFPVAFGDFRRGYLIVDRIAMELQRDPYTQNTSGLIRFVARKRVGGQVILAEAIRKLKIAAS